MLREAYRKCGSVKGVEESTRAGTACTGCKVMLHSLFGEAPSNHYEKHETPQFGTTCKKPGSRIMKGFVLALGDSMQSTIYSSNGIAPQLGSCDADTKIEWHLLNHRGESVRNGQQMLRTNETFVFRTTEHALPNPFFGIFLLAFERANYGASRFNLYWGLPCIAG